MVYNAQMIRFRPHALNDKINNIYAYRNATIYMVIVNLTDLNSWHARYIQFYKAYIELACSVRSFAKTNFSEVCNVQVLKTLDIEVVFTIFLIFC